MNLPLLGTNAYLTETDRARVVKVSDALLRAGKDLSAGDVHVFVLGALNAIGYAIGRADPPVAPDFISSVVVSVPLYINAYKKDGNDGRFSKDS